MVGHAWIARTASAALGAAMLLVVPGCYEGPEDPENVAWNGGEGDEGSSIEDDGDLPSGDDGDGADGGGDGWPSGDDGDDSDTGADPTGGSDGGSDPTGGDDGGSDPTGGDDGGSDDGGGDDGGSDDGGDAPPPSDEVPDNAYCGDVAAWDAAHLQLENEILEIVNQVRAQGANCGSAGSFGPAGPMTMDPALRCAARVHSLDMVDRNFFDHTNPSGESPFDRMGFAGYSYSTAGENIAAGNGTAAATMDQWMNSDGHCSNIMNPDFTEIGVGYYPGGQYGHMWTQVFGRP
ncbi:MAG: CAP domain-containing protein [Myxococcota bacterium]